MPTFAVVFTLLDFFRQKPQLVASVAAHPLPTLPQSSVNQHLYHQQLKSIPEFTSSVHRPFQQMHEIQARRTSVINPFHAHPSLTSYHASPHLSSPHHASPHHATPESSHNAPLVNKSKSQDKGKIPVKLKPKSPHKTFTVHRNKSGKARGKSISPVKTVKRTVKSRKKIELVSLSKLKSQETNARNGQPTNKPPESSTEMLPINNTETHQANKTETHPANQMDTHSANARQLFQSDRGRSVHDKEHGESSSG